ncbi:MAG: Fe-S cluster assembly protein HesB [Nanoarchaeota archaeon]
MNQRAFQQKILTWYATHKRDLSWRQTTDPYRILISEIMLQQTQVDRVISKYLLFLETFPTVHDLARASRGDVLALWSGLGYNRRAIHLQDAAQHIVKDYEGIFPKNRDALLTLPGVGPYTANAILSFAFNLSYPCIDTNIRRILIHELHLSEAISMKELYKIAEKLIPKGRSRDWHNALMDYGSAVLTTKKTGIKPLTTQSKFLHSRRWYRGQIMKLLVQKKKINLDYLILALKKEKFFLEEILQEMEKERLIIYANNLAQLP